MAKKYQSNRQRNVNIGIVSYTENETVLTVDAGKVSIGLTDQQYQQVDITNGLYVGKLGGDGVGIGTTTTNRAGLYVVGDGYFTGVVTATTFFAGPTEITGGQIVDEADIQKLRVETLYVAGISTFVDGTVTIGVGTGVTTGTAGQLFQVYSGAYIEGPVGLGTTNTYSDSELHVAGAIKLDGTIYDTDGFGGNLDDILYSNGDGTVAWRTALQGTQGTQGLQGALSNFQGTQGLQGLQGNQGVQGNQGTQGLQGLQGNQGVQGVQGLQGLQGNQGVQGGNSETSLIVALGDEFTNIGIGTSVVTFRAPFAFKITEAPSIAVSQPGVIGITSVNVLYNARFANPAVAAGWTSLYANNAVANIATGGYSSEDNKSFNYTLADNSGSNPELIINRNDKIRFDIVGVSTGSKGLKAIVYYSKFQGG